QKRTKLGSRFKRIHSKQIPKDESFKTLLLESLALIFGDLSPTSASAHMNYLIKLLKSWSLRQCPVDVWRILPDFPPGSTAI
ncbi:hypothetical protein, partial [Vreelandella boliviensis]|uniref:hypothetical protein n=1 Tax=Vreelandella boliviensis TaxID=223527 RepID=UPI001B8C4B07